MDFSKLSSLKRQSKLSKKAQASLDHGTNVQFRTKCKDTNHEDDDSPVPPKRVKLAPPNGTCHAQSGNALSNPCPPGTIPRLTHNTSLMSSSGLTDGDTSHPGGPSDSERVVSTKRGGNGSLMLVTVIEDSDNDNAEMVDGVAVTESEEMAGQEKVLSMCPVKNLINIHQCCYSTINEEMDVTCLHIFSP
jgi:hypothetical protein